VFINQLNQNKLNLINELLVSPMQRDNRIDSIRGLLLILITINHFGGRIADYVWQPLGFVSDAEGFIFISGFVFALVYSKFLVNSKLFVKKTIHRCFTIYKYHFSLVLGIPFIGILISGYPQGWGNAFGFLKDYGFCKYSLATIPMIYQPYLMDVLPLYIVLIILSCPFLILLYKGKGSLALVLTFSLWVIGQFINPGPMLCRYLFHAPTSMSFNIFLWQLIFMTGIYLGYKKKIGEDVPFIKNRAVKILLAVIFVVCMVLRHSGRINEPLNAFLLGITNREFMSLSRIINFFAVIYVISAILKHIPEKYGIPGICYLGKHSLQVFAFHIAFSYLVMAPFAHTDSAGFGTIITTKYGNIIYLCILAISIAAIFIPAFLHDMYLNWSSYKKKRPNQALSRSLNIKI
jgi:hypothetical protein